MPYENTGKTITKIKINQKNVILSFGKNRLSISPEAYSLSYLYVGKTLSPSEIKKLKEYSSMAVLLNYSLSILKKGHYTEWRMREKLYAKEASKKEVDFIITRLKNIDLINDDMFIADYLAYAEEKNLGKNRILKELNEKGIFPKDLQKIKFPESKEKKKAQAQVKRLEIKYASSSFEKKKQKIYQNLLSLGFDSGLASEALNVMASKNDKDEQKKIEQDYTKLKLRLSRQYEGKQLQQKIGLSLKNKGYRYSDIMKIMEENDDGND